MLDIQIQSNEAEALKLMRSLPNTLIPKAAAQTLNRTRDNARAELTRRIRGRMNLKASIIRESMKTAGRATERNLRAYIDFDYRPVPLREFSAKASKRGVRVTVRKGKREELRGLFMVERFGGHVFSRAKKQESRPLRGRTGSARWFGMPIEKRFGPTVRSQAERLIPEMTGFVSDRLLINMRQAVNRFTPKARGRRA